MSRDEIRQEVRRWQRLWGMQKWDIRVSFTADSDDVASVTMEPEYWRATISFNLDRIKSASDARAAILHEMAHVMMSPYTEMAEVFAGDAARVLKIVEEQICTAVEKMPVWRKLSADD